MQDKTNIDETIAAEPDRVDVTLEGESGDANLRTPNRGQLACVSIAALLCVALIGASAWALVSGNGLSLGAGAQSEGSSIQTDGSSAGDEGAGKHGASGDASEDGGDAGSAGNAAASDPAAGAGKADSENTGVGGSSHSSQAPGAGGSSSTDGTSGATDGSAGNQDSPAPAPRTVTVTISADGSLGGGGGLGPVTLTFEEGATVYDALASAGWSAQADWGAFGAYVTSINGVTAGPNTGWTYTVNGAQPNYACSAYTLSDGDAIHWTFVEVK